MPLMKSSSKPAFEHNIKAEMKAGKPMKQSLAIAYDVKRRSARRKMADGGPAPARTGDYDTDVANARKAQSQGNGPAPTVPQFDSQGQAAFNQKLARGGMVAPKFVGGMRKHTDQDSEMQAGMPGMRISTPDEEDMISHLPKPGEMDRRPTSERIRMARYQAEMEANGMSSSEMGHFADGGDVDSSAVPAMPSMGSSSSSQPQKKKGMFAQGGPIIGAMKQHDSEDTEYGKGQPGMRTSEPCPSCYEMHDSEMGCGMPGKSIPTPEGDLRERGMSSSEMGHFAEGGMASRMAGNAKLEQAYSQGKPTSISDSIMRKKRMADGGQVDIDLNAMEEGEDSLGSSPLDNMDRHAAQKENYDEGMHSAFGDTGEDEMHGASISERIKRKRMR